MAAPKLPRELVTLVVDALFEEPIADRYEQFRLQDQLSSFKTLRRVAKAVKADAHRAWPAGVACLAHTGAKRLLYPDPDLPPPDFQQGLRQLSPVLGETKSLSSDCERLDWDGHRVGSQEHLEWFAGLVQVVRTTRVLESLTLDFHEATARFNLRRLPLSHLRLRSLCLHGLETKRLKGLDLAWMDTLETLSIIGDKLGGNMRGFRLPPKASSIVLSWLGITSDQLDALALDEVVGLRHLDLTQSRLVRPLRLLPGLQELVLDYSRFANGLALERLAPWAQLEDVSLFFVEAISSAAPLRLGANRSIRRLRMGGPNVCDPAAFELANNASLQILHVDRCQLESLAFGLPRNGTLRELSLGGCTLTAPMVHQLVGELAGNSTLAKLDLSNCSITNEAMGHFRLEKTSGLEELDLSGNDFSDEGLQPLAASITDRGLLRKLDLSYCDKVSEALLARFAACSLTEVKP